MRTVTVTIDPSSTEYDRSTVTVTSTAYYDVSVTSTSTAYSLVTSTATVIETITSVDVSTTNSVKVSTSDSTTTIASSAGFLPVGDTINGYPVAGKAKAKKMKKRNNCKPQPPQLSSSASSLVRASSSSAVPQLYPSEVICQPVADISLTSTVTATASTVTVTVTPSASTLDVTSTITSTVTDIADTTIIESFSASSTETVTVDSTSIVTVTSTTVVAGPLQTFYASCAASNVVDLYNGASIDEVDIPSGINYGFYTTTTAYDCCVLCMTTSNCAGSIWFSTGDTCYLLLSSTCSAQSNVVAGTFPYSGHVGSTGAYVSNGNCGYFHGQ